MSQKEQIPENPLSDEDLLRPNDLDVIFDGSLSDPTSLRRKIPVKPEGMSLHDWWKIRGFFPEGDNPTSPDHHKIWQESGLLPSQPDKK